MRTCISILLLATFISCGKKTNEINSYKTTNTFISEKALTIPHDVDGSVIRPKLLNKLVENSFPPSEENSNSIIQIHDELHNVELSGSELKDYEIKEKLLTKVVVSFSDREEVYFVKDRIPAQDLILTLGLKPELDRKLKLIAGPYNQTFIGSTFYIVSVNHEELMKNDQKFFSKESAMTNFQEKILIEKKKAILIKVDYDFKVQSLAPLNYTAPKIRCSRESLEDGSCGSGCSFTADLPVNKFEKMLPNKLQDLGLVINYADAFVKVDQSSALNLKDNYFEIKIDSTDMGDQEIPFQISQIPSTIYSGGSAHYNFSSGCSSEDRAKVSRYNRNTQVNMNLKVHLLGRGEELKKIKL